MFSLPSAQWQIAFIAMRANTLLRVNFHSMGGRQSPTAFLCNRHTYWTERSFTHKAIFIEIAS